MIFFCAALLPSPPPKYLVAKLPVRTSQELVLGMWKWEGEGSFRFFFRVKVEIPFPSWRNFRLRSNSEFPKFSRDPPPPKKGGGGKSLVGQDFSQVVFSAKRNAYWLCFPASPSEGHSLLFLFLPSPLFFFSLSLSRKKWWWSRVFKRKKNWSCHFFSSVILPFSFSPIFLEKDEEEGKKNSLHCCDTCQLQEELPNPKRERTFVSSRTIGPTFCAHLLYV